MKQLPGERPALAGWLVKTNAEGESITATGEPRRPDRKRSSFVLRTLSFLLFMHCPACHAENANEAATCTACGGSLRNDSTPSSAAPPSPPARCSGSRRCAPADEGEATDRQRRASRAFRLSLWSLVPGLGLLLAPVAFVLGCLIVPSCRATIWLAARPEWPLSLARRSRSPNGSASS